ncbi:MAG: DMT family transporter [Vulcanimicrobiaceae bacterium]
MDNGKRLGATEWLLLAILSVLWGGSFFFFKVLVNAHLPPFTIVLGRVAIAALALLAFVHFTGRRMPRSPSVWLAFLVMGALNNAIPFSLIVFGETRLDSGLAAIFNATTPMFTILLAHAFTSDERLTPNKVLGIALGLLGVIVLTGLQAVHGVNLASIAQVAYLGAAFAYGCAGIYGRRFRAMGVDPIIAATGQLCGSTLLVPHSRCL